MSSQIRPNRLEVSDRFPMLGFTIRSEPGTRACEVAIATDPELFRPDAKGRRTRSNFYSSRSAGPIPLTGGESVYVVAPEVLARFVGQERLYFGLATYAGDNGGAPSVAV